MALASRQKYQRKPLTLNLNLGKNYVEQVREHRVLGVVIGDQLKLQPNRDSICKHLSKTPFLLGHLTHFVDSDDGKIFFQVHLLSQVIYASIIWSGAS